MNVMLYKINLSSLASLIDKWANQCLYVYIYLNVIVERWETRSKNFVVLSIDVVIIRLPDILNWQLVIVDSCTLGIREDTRPVAVSHIVTSLSKSVAEHKDLPSGDIWQFVTICSWTPFHYKIKTNK